MHSDCIHSNQPNLCISCSTRRNLSASMTPNDISFIPEGIESSSKIMYPNQRFRIVIMMPRNQQIRFRGFINPNPRIHRSDPRIHHDSDSVDSS
ncbi:hypothetical protein AVEN_133677-1 [Araneus ventricosus]|uniref:Uncharacterized protein n=1 Tax=Araneus ventricosus TaxID=182803 RepID=A0A4Y2B9J9_ARAVE|nr:hypothetical protein AVEN_133677-1 [Araneus ventricosus]